MPRPSTFSIVAFDPELEAWGIAVASKFPAVGAVVPWAEAGAGAVATQSFANTSYGPRGLDLMRSGLSAQQALDQLLQGDQDRATRQAGLVDAQGKAATFTGEDCYDWAGGQIGENYAAQGNILAGPQVIEAMTSTFQESELPLPERLLAALLAADRAGGDRRGKQSAALLVVKSEAGYAGFNDRWIDYRVDDHNDPVIRLGQLLELHHLYFGESPPEDKAALEGELLEKLKIVMARLGYYEGEIDEQWSQETRQALRAFVGNENFEERVDLEAGTIDQPVLDYLLTKFES
ncbi:MAG: DUF1028 domain-containing protein [Anaerolineales bacterium]